MEHENFIMNFSQIFFSQDSKEGEWERAAGGVSGSSKRAILQLLKIVIVISRLLN